MLHLYIVRRPRQIESKYRAASNRSIGTAHIHPASSPKTAAAISPCTLSSTSMTLNNAPPSKHPRRLIVRTLPLNLMYKSRWGFQRTNFVIAFLAKTLLQNAEEMIDEAQHLFNTMQQMERQSGMSYVSALQKKRTELQNLGVRITDQQMKSRIYTSLNPTFKKHFQHYRYSQVTLQEFQDAIRDADASDKRNLQVQRHHQEDVWNLTKAETISHDLRESFQNGDQEDLPEVQPRAAESFRENDVKDEFSQQQRNTFLKTPREFSEANEVTLLEYPSSQPPYKKLKAVGAIPRTNRRWNKWVNPNRRRWI